MNKIIDSYKWEERRERGAVGECQASGRSAGASCSDMGSLEGERSEAGRVARDQRSL